MRDNTARRGEQSCGLVGHGWFGSKEYYQGPLSGYGSPGSALGDVATGSLTSYPFTITGDFFRLLVGGGYYPESCYVALVDINADTLLMKESGHGSEHMTERIWDVRPYQGLLAVITIVDAEQGVFGHINVDEIEECVGPVTDVGDERPLVATRLHDLGPRPNPCNPGTEIRFSLAAPGRYQVSIHDLRGRLVWRSREVAALAGTHTIAWNGRGRDDRHVPAGVYLYRIRLDGQVASLGKVSVVR